MAISARIPAGADTAGFIPEQWSTQVIDVMQMDLVTAKVVDTTWKKDLRKGDTINCPILNEPSAVEVTVGTPGVVQDIMTGTALQIVVNQWWECPVVIDEMTDLQSQVSVQTDGAKLAAYAINKKIDSTVTALFSALDNGGGTDGVAITDPVLIAAVEKLDEADVPTEDRSWVFDPSCRADMYAIDKFVRNDYVKDGVIPTGKIGQVYGSPVYITNNLTVGTTGNIGAYLHKKAIALVVQANPKSLIVAEPLKHQNTILTHALWGVKEMRGTFGYYILTRKS
jgi:hypothetical protein